MSALNSNNAFDGLDEPVRPAPGGRKRRLDKENHKKIGGVLISTVGCQCNNVTASKGCVNLTLLTSKRGALATDTRGCSLWRSLLERPPPAPETRVRCNPGYINTMLVRPVYSMSP